MSCLKLCIDAAQTNTVTTSYFTASNQGRTVTATVFLEKEKMEAQWCPSGKSFPNKKYKNNIINAD